MKILLFLIVITFVLPTYATCPLETGAACTISQFKEIDSPKGPSRRKINEFLDAPKQDSNPIPENIIRKQEDFQDFGNQPKDYSYNADCQFGVCKNSSGAPQLFEHREK